ncbi:MAG: DtxR family Mn-dependent transcriptional regulator [Saprospiraceae bacterium]|jgi:DtxR family Mn-dependent transcriptional regulator
MLSHTEENYLKAIFKLLEKGEKSASTNAISKEISTSAASVTDMLKRLSEKKLIHYEKYKGVTLTTTGNSTATSLIRKHRLWEVFLVDKLNFSWDEVHDIAEEMEHIQSNELINRLDAFLEHPKFDPHGDPIPDKEGNFAFRHQTSMKDIKVEGLAIIVGVKEHSTPFLQYLDQIGLILGTPIQVLEHIEYDGSTKIKINDTIEHIISFKVSKNIFVQKS